MDNEWLQLPILRRLRMISDRIRLLDRCHGLRLWASKEGLEEEEEEDFLRDRLIEETRMLQSKDKTVKGDRKCQDRVVCRSTKSYLQDPDP